jgi:hypothetical protein
MTRSLGSQPALAARPGLGAAPDGPYHQAQAAQGEAVRATNAGRSAELEGRRRAALGARAARLLPVLLVAGGALTLAVIAGATLAENWRLGAFAGLALAVMLGPALVTSARRLRRLQVAAIATLARQRLRPAA